MTDYAQFTLNYAEKFGEVTNTNTTVLSGDKAEYLPSILAGIARFLSSAGFTYLSGEVVKVDGGYLILDKGVKPVDTFEEELAAQNADPVNQVAPFKVGERVRHNDPGMVDPGLGTVTEVIDLTDVCSSYRVKTDLEPFNTFNVKDGAGYFWDHEVSAFKGFKVGDKVRFLPDEDSQAFRDRWFSEMPEVLTVSCVDSEDGFLNFEGTSKISNPHRITLA
jgi:hypothetical protein